jgi:hypothetical protein
MDEDFGRILESVDAFIRGISQSGYFVKMGQSLHGEFEI